MISIHRTTISQSVKQNGCKFYGWLKVCMVFPFRFKKLLCSLLPLLYLPHSSKNICKYLTKESEMKKAHIHDFPKLLRICSYRWLPLKSSTFFNITSWIFRILKSNYVTYLCKISFKYQFLQLFCMPLEICW